MKKLLFLFSLSFLFISCNKSFVRPTVYEPKKTKIIFPFYVDGNPFASVITKSSAFQSSISLTKLSYRNYIRLWVSYTNLSDRPVLFEPMKSFQLIKFDLHKKSQNKFNPEYPSKIVKMVNNQKQSAQLANALLGVLVMASTNATTYYGTNGSSVQVNDLQEKLNLVARNTAMQAENISQNYDRYISSLNSLFLKKNTVFPNKTVSGFVYFQVNKNRDVKYYADKFAYLLKSNFADINNSIQFLPVKGD